MRILLLLLPVCLINMSKAQDSSLPLVAGSNREEPSRVDYHGFTQASADLEEFRRSRLIDLDTFLRMAQESNTIMLDTRSEAAYERKHLKGARHLNFSDFTEEKLRQVIPNKSTRVLIYCNNNLRGDDRNFPMKRVSLALNIPTFINLHGYGYENLYELASLISVEDTRLHFAGTDVDAQHQL